MGVTQALAIRTGSLVVGLLILCFGYVGQVAPAYATTREDQFIQDVQSNGIGSPDGRQGILDAGYQVCQWLSKGYSVEYATQRLIAEAGLTRTNAVLFSMYSSLDLCPNY